MQTSPEIAQRTAQDVAAAEAIVHALLSGLGPEDLVWTQDPHHLANKQHQEQEEEEEILLKKHSVCELELDVHVTQVSIS